MYRTRTRSASRYSRVFPTQTAGKAPDQYWQAVFQGGLKLVVLKLIRLELTLTELVRLELATTELVVELIGAPVRHAAVD